MRETPSLFVPREKSRLHTVLIKSPAEDSAELQIDSQELKRKTP
jgi:hypothetical protein